MRRGDLEKGKIYVNSNSKRFRLITGAGNYPLCGWQEDRDCFQYLSVIVRTKGMVFEAGHYTDEGRCVVGGNQGIYGHLTRASMASWAVRQATAYETDEVKRILKAEGVLKNEYM